MHVDRRLRPRAQVELTGGVLVRTGGSLPIVPALAARGIPTVVTGFDLPDGNIHAPNERLRVEHLDLGVAAARELFHAWGSLSASA